jgi:hypothetical protein
LPSSSIWLRIRMLGQRNTKAEKKSDADERRKHISVVSERLPGLLHTPEWSEEDIISGISSQRQLAMLSDEQPDEQRYHLAMQLQQSRGNAYVQRLLESEGTRKKQVQTNAVQRTTAPPAPTEKVGSGLWAKDEKGNNLPPNLEDISQGGLADCYLIGALAAIVNSNPQKIVDMIKDNGNGTYTVTFKGIGTFTSATQTVSADFEVGKHANVTKRQAFWPLIIEKAYAQQKGGTSVISQGGNPGTATEELTNVAPSRFDPRDKTADFIFAKLAQAKEKKWPATMLSPKKDTATPEKKKIADESGIYFWHTYTVIDVDSKTMRIKLFNPWGFQHPNGDGWIDVEKVGKFFIEVSING